LKIRKNSLERLEELEEVSENVTSPSETIDVLTQTREIYKELIPSCDYISRTVIVLLKDNPEYQKYVSLLDKQTSLSRALEELNKVTKELKDKYKIEELINSKSLDELYKKMDSSLKLKLEYIRKKYGWLSGGEKFWNDEDYFLESITSFLIRKKDLETTKDEALEVPSDYRFGMFSRYYILKDEQNTVIKKHCIFVRKLLLNNITPEIKKRRIKKDVPKELYDPVNLARNFTYDELCELFH
jgi:hypothetical protein